MGDPLRLRELRPDDEREFRAAAAAMASDPDFDFALGLRPDLAWLDLAVAAGLGIASVLVTCHEDNTGSRKAIEACGGRLESVVESATPGAPPVRRYRIG